MLEIGGYGKVCKVGEVPPEVAYSYEDKKRNTSDKEASTDKVVFLKAALQVRLGRAFILCNLLKHVLW